MSHYYIRCPSSLFFSNDTATTEIYTLSLHDALPISRGLEPGKDGAVQQAEGRGRRRRLRARAAGAQRHHSLGVDRSEEHTSELQSQSNLVCRLLLEKKKKKHKLTINKTTQSKHIIHT